MIELAHVAGKFVAQEGFERGRFEAAEMLAIPLGVLPEEMGGERLVIRVSIDRWNKTSPCEVAIKTSSK